MISCHVDFFLSYIIKVLRVYISVSDDHQNHDPFKAFERKHHRMANIHGQDGR